MSLPLEVHQIVLLLGVMVLSMSMKEGTSVLGVDWVRDRYMITTDVITRASSGLPRLLPQTDRSLGLHVSSIITDLCLRLGYYDERTDDTVDHTLMELGSTFEWAFIQRLLLEFPDRYFILPEISLDGIYGHIDLLDLREERVIEIKFTYRSTGKVICEVGQSPPPNHSILSTKFWKDRSQLKAYCRMMKWTRGRLEICHIKGDYQKDEEGRSKFRVIHNGWNFDYTIQSLTSHWDGLRRHADDYACRECLRFNYQGHEKWCNRKAA